MYNSTPFYAVALWWLLPQQKFFSEKRHSNFFIYSMCSQKQYLAMLETFFFSFRSFKARSPKYAPWSKTGPRSHFIGPHIHLVNNEIIIYLACLHKTTNSYWRFQDSLLVIYINCTKAFYLRKLRVRRTMGSGIERN